MFAMLRPVSIAFMLLLSLALWPGHGQARSLDVRTGQIISDGQLTADLKGVRLIFIGEIHDNRWHHQVQLRIIRGLHEAGVPLTIGLEMLRHDSQWALDRWVNGTMSEGDFALVFDNNWGMWPDYQAIFRYARGTDLPMIGLNIGRKITGQVASAGFSSLSPDQRREVPLVTCDVDQTYQDYMHQVLGKFPHGGMSFHHFCEAQMVWDAVMAKNLIAYLDSHPDRTVVVLAGSGHSWKFGIPTQIHRHLQIPLRVVIPEIPGRLDRTNVTPAEADYLVLPDAGR